MEKLKIEIVKKVIMLDTSKELQDVHEFVRGAISRECDEDDKEQEEYREWKKNKSND